jgi:hypothetical protein
MDALEPDDLRALVDQIDRAELDAHAIVSGLSEASGTRRPSPAAWSIAECLDHLATGNRVYVQAMQAAALRAREQQRWRRGPAQPGAIARLFVLLLEPPVRNGFKMKSPNAIRPRPAPGLAESFAAFVASQNDVRIFLREHGNLDLTGVGFRNPFVRGIRFSLATGLHVIAAHERRHLWQARRVREQVEPATRQT